MTKERIYEELQELQAKMYSVAERMMQHKEAPWLRHGVELHRAADIVNDWLEGIAEDEYSKF